MDDDLSAEQTQKAPSFSYQVADSFRPALEGAKAQVEAEIAGIKGAMVEDNTFSVSVHYRMVEEEEDRERVKAIVDEVVGNMPMLRRTEGKMVYELRPSADWDKGKAVEWLLDKIQNDFDRKVFPFYIGDDVTDEDAFRMMDDLKGLGIIVSETAVEHKTAATFALRNPYEVVEFLSAFVNTPEGEPPSASSELPRITEGEEELAETSHSPSGALSGHPQGMHSRSPIGTRGPPSPKGVGEAYGFPSIGERRHSR